MLTTTGQDSHVLERLVTRLVAIGLSVLLCLPAVALMAPTTQATIQIHYVTVTGAGSKNGADWADAYQGLASALPVVSSGEIWVAAGTYKPTTDTDQTKSFTLVAGVAVYGGFAGTETLRSQRDWATNVTILSGDLGGNDSGPAALDNATMADNSYHVVVGATNATLDGFTITAGNAYAGTANGGGIHDFASSPTLANLTVTGNVGSAGGGIFNDADASTTPHVASNPSLTNVTISGNAAEDGGGIENYGSSPSLTNVTISGNSATSNSVVPSHGGGIVNTSGSNATFVDVVISGNSADFGGGLYNDGSNPVLVNVTITGNAASTAGGGIGNYDYSDPTMRNGVVWANAAGSIDNQDSGLGISAMHVSYSIVEGGVLSAGTVDDGHNLDSDPLFVAAVSGTLPNSSGNLALRVGSPAVDAGDPSDTTVTLGISTDRGDAPRIVNSVVDMGAYEGQNACLPGYYSATGDDRDGCIPASTGHYVDHTGATSQSPCLAGYFAANTAQTSCDPASTGHYVDQPASDHQSPCALGYFAANTAQTSCDPASTGHYVDHTGAIGQTACALGYYQPGTAQSSCLAAGIGYYVDSTGSASETACPAGQTTSATASTSASDCFATVLTPYQTKQAAAASLQALLPTGSQHADKRLRRAIHQIDNSLVSWRWIGQNALVAQYGYGVFNGEKHAVVWLTIPFFAANSTVTGAIDALVGADRQLVVNAIAASSDAQANAKANARLAHADALVSAGHKAKAIYMLWRAWRVVK